LVEHNQVVLLDMERLESRMCFKIEGSHDIAPFKVFVLIFHHINDVINFLFNVKSQIVVPITVKVNSSYLLKSVSSIRTFWKSGVNAQSKSGADIYFPIL
jgi:hypothetical protein